MDNLPADPANDRPISPDVYLIRHKHVPILIGVAACVMACVGTTGMYVGRQSWDATKQHLQSSFDAQIVTLQAEHAAETKRLDEQTTQLLQEKDQTNGLLVDQNKTLIDAVVEMKLIMGQRAKVGDRTLATVQKIEQQSRVDATKTEQLVVATKAIESKSTESASSAKVRQQANVEQPSMWKSLFGTHH
jgi:hypothetical protein